MGPRLAEYDHAVVGAGGVGSAVAYYLSRSPGRTLVLDRFFENHAFGSSHGKTRLLRTAYSEGSTFVPLVLRARTLWKQLGHEANREIFHRTGVLLAGPSNSPELVRAQGSARANHLPYEMLDGIEAGHRFPAFRFDRGDAAVWDPGGGVLFPERAIHEFCRGARKRGAHFRWNSPVTRWKTRPDGRVHLTTPRQDYVADRVVFSAGAWLTTLVPELQLPLVVEQQSVYWFMPNESDRGSYRKMPGFVWYQRDGEYFYGTPDFGDGIKVGGSRGRVVRDLSRRPTTSVRETRAVRGFVRNRMHGVSAAPARQVRCLYTNTPDRNFIVSVHPDHSSIVLVSACSGHGFKFTSAIGELVAQAMSGRWPSSLAPFHMPAPGRPN